MIGLCAPDIASLGKLNAAHGDKFVAGGYDLTAENLAAIKGGHAYVSLGQSPFVQGYLPVVLLVEAIKNKKPTPTGFYDAGTQVVTANSVDMGPGLPKVTFARIGDARRRSQSDRGLLQRVDQVGFERADPSRHSECRRRVAIGPASRTSAVAAGHDRQARR